MYLQHFTAVAIRSLHQGSRSWCDNKRRQWKHHSCGVFTNPVNKSLLFLILRKTGSNHTADVLKIDSDLQSFWKWLGDSRINVRLSGTNREDGYAVYRIPLKTAFGGTELSAEGWRFLQFMIERLLE